MIANVPDQSNRTEEIGASEGPTQRCSVYLTDVLPFVYWDIANIVMFSVSHVHTRSSSSSLMCVYSIFVLKFYCPCTWMNSVHPPSCVELPSSILIASAYIKSRGIHGKSLRINNNCIVHITDRARI